ncbi:AraC family transcriptional regulator [Pelagicoccus sp. SDUM812003]|uniref:helix-turn-helix domain-containing protein n=1 Tax=Pelagicoccus sp. SDUM812003 TaxID=3041267 RepID=UPI00280CE011|nr:AraC family transcriptional regulator [Pelagicoccus sp. SDUM812003]MDQ8204625.1 AraC family transcriptional regulator [Pelagicoccus sp. SDUM812003]
MPSDFAIYLPRTDEPSAWMIDILGTGFAAVGPNEAYPRDQHPEDHSFEWSRGRTLSEYQVIFIARGNGLLETENSGAIAVEAPAVFVLFPKVWHRYRPAPESGWEEHWIAFDGAYADRIRERGVLDPSSPLRQVGHAEALLGQFQLVQEEVRSEALGFRSIAASAIIQILALSTNLPLRRKEESQAIRSVIRKATFMLREHDHAAISPEEIAAKLNVGYTYFRRMFKQYTGMSPKQYHSQLRLERAKRMLLYSEMNVSQIAEALSFGSPFHFSNWFKKLCAQAPSDWRESNRPQ